MNYYRKALSASNTRQLIPELQHGGYQDADPLKRPTFQKLGCLGLDYAFYSPEAKASDFHVIPAKGVSDHDAIRVKVSARPL